MNLRLFLFVLEISLHTPMAFVDFDIIGALFFIYVYECLSGNVIVPLYCLDFALLGISGRRKG